MESLSENNAIEDDFTDEQIDALLKQAEQRLKLQSQPSLGQSQDDLARLRASRTLAIQGLPTPYIDTSGDVTRADQRRLLDERQRTLANGVRKIEDPLVTKQQVLEVS